MGNKTLNDICGDLLKNLFGEDILEDANFKETPARMARMYHEMFTSVDLIKTVSESLAKKKFPSSYDGIILLPNIRAISFCPHHMLPVEYDITIAYIPGKEGSVIGASKPERIAKTLGAFPWLQESYTEEIARCIHTSIHPEGVAVLVTGKHSCMRIRGIKNPCAEMTTSKMIGGFKDNSETRAEFFSILANTKRG